MSSLEQIFYPIKDHLDQIELYSRSRFKQDSKLISEIEMHSFQSGGKRVRPAMMLLTALHFNYNKDDLKKLSAILEYIHTASLMHDDVVDESFIRRNKKTANSIWGNKSVVLVGDYLFAKAYDQMTEINNLEIVKLFSTTIALLSEGEILQLKHNINNYSTKKYFEIIRRKTACLFAAAMQSGAIITEQPIKIKQDIYKCGESIGMAFQIIDDLLDYLGEKSGKINGSDLKERKITLPLLKLLKVLNSKKKQELQQFIEQGYSEEKLKTIVELMHQYKIFGACFEIAKNHIKQAKKILLVLSDSVYRNKLIELSNFIIKRDY